MPVYVYPLMLLMSLSHRFCGGDGLFSLFYTIYPCTKNLWIEASPLCVEEKWHSFAVRLWNYCGIPTNKDCQTYNEPNSRREKKSTNIRTAHDLEPKKQQQQQHKKCTQNNTTRIRTTRRILSHSISISLSLSFAVCSSSECSNGNLLTKTRRTHVIIGSLVNPSIYLYICDCWHFCLYHSVLRSRSKCLG